MGGIIGLFSSSKVETPVGNSTFADRMSSIKSAFKIAHENASTLHGEMEQAIILKENQIKELNQQIDEINVTKKEAEEFMENISKLI